MAITPTEILTVRRRTSATTDEMSDAVITAIYNSTSQGNSDLNRTTYYTLIDLLGVTAALIDTSDPTLPSSASYSQRFEHIRDVLLPLWANITGIGAASMALSVTSTYTYRADSLQTEEPTYERGALGDWVTGDV